ncbi:hypothetical protein F2P81_021362 [Scophthalmus maximus]|uniref:Guanine nucleotide exchange factor DBS-like n=1 Tax=Scophthalmus maximus TaxID=52904 RepID=A0A6A4S308_SCOMX|nr:hypothetical protein F2P81_021362 [Scophthalmus maximus]
MGGEEMADSGFLMEEDGEVELDSGFCIMEAGSELGLVGQVRAGSDECPDTEELDWSVKTGNMDSLSESKKQRDGGTGEDGGSQTQEEDEMEADTETKKVKDEGSGDQSDEVKREQEALDVCLWPAEESGGHVRISLEEVERYYRFSRYCHWLCDEIMQLDSSPLHAADITPDLQKQFAFLTGGRGDNGSPIIVFPEFPAFGEITDREFHNVLTYLTSVPSLSSTDVGFILVIDRRQDRWAAVKGTLLRIAGSFPGNLQLVLVLRPTTLLQRTLSDILFKFNRDEFKMKVPVIMLSSVTELHSYIDGSQLTLELGGTQEYNHEKWISHRTAIEGFARMVKKTAQTLQSFGTELAETELPNEIHATSVLLSTHTSKKDKMKEDLLVALDQGRRLLESINEPVARDPDHNMNQDELENLATVQRLLSQLDETERAFDEFWVRHHTKLEQCLQLRHFEHNYREVRALLDQVSEKLATFSEVGISPAHDEHILCELTTYEERVCEVLDRASALSREGEQLIQNSHYAEDSIQPKCSELRTIGENVSSSLKDKKDHFLKAMELHHCLERASKWVDDGIYLLASQPVDKCQSHEGAELALQELERYLDNPGQNQLTDLSTLWKEYDAVLNQQFKGNDQLQNGGSSSRHASLSEEEENLAVLRRHVMNELLETERAYVEELLCVLQGYASEMDNPAMSNLIPAPLQNKKEVLFGNMPEIYHFHKRTFLRELEQYTDCPELVGRCFLERMTDLQIYEKYCHNKPRSESLWRQCSDCAFFQECQKKLEHKLGLDSYLLKPVQRITKYQLLLKEMLKYSKGCEGTDDLQEALTSILGILKAVNDSMHLIAITGYEGNLSELGKLLMQGSFSVWMEHKKGHAKVKDLARFKPMQRHLFLHEKALLFCKRREENGEGYEKAPSYSFKQSLNMSVVGITENAKGDNKKFEVWCNSREEVYIVQTGQRSFKKGEEKKGEACIPDVNSSSSKPTGKGWNKTSLSLDASEEHDGYSSADDPLNSDQEDDNAKKLCAGKYTVMVDYKKTGAHELSLKSGEVVQLVKEGDDGRWFVRNLSSSKEGWIPAANLTTLIEKSKSCQSLTSSEGSGSGNLSSSSSCSETYTSFSDVKP